MPGGILNIDGVTVEDLSPDLPPFQDQKQYLLLLDFFDTSADPAFHGVGNLTLGPDGAFLVVNDRLVAISRKPNPISRDLRLKFDNSMNSLRAYASTRCEPGQSK